jgi:hypothetical protein
LVNVVVVFKIDRLSRSLMDFSKLVEVFDRSRQGLFFCSSRTRLFLRMPLLKDRQIMKTRGPWQYLACRAVARCETPFSPGLGTSRQEFRLEFTCSGFIFFS